MALVTTSTIEGVVDIALNDPQRRNALGIEMFDAIDDALRVADDVRVVLLRGEGRVFCAGFDLGACVDNPKLLSVLIRRLRDVNVAMRRLPQPVIMAVHGAAIAGGCAMVSAADLVITSGDAKLGYPVHRIGVSPAVSAPTLMDCIGEGPARELMMSGRLIDGHEAHRIGLASHIVTDSSTIHQQALQIAARLASHGQHALRITKAWLNELDGSSTDGRFDEPAEHSAAAAMDKRTQTMLAAFWSARLDRAKSR